MGHDRGTPPADWPGLEMTGVTRLTDEIYYGWISNERKVHDGCWVAADVSRHTLVSREPLHLEPSLLWQCCGTHGFVRGGVWIPA